MYLHDCLLSVANQTYHNFEAIIVDDGSPDNSHAIANFFVNEDKRFSLIRQKNKGLSGARNTGIKAAKGDYLLFLDSDDQLEITAIEKLVEASENHGADVVFPDRYIKIYSGSDKKRLEYHFRPQKANYCPKFFALEIMMGMGRAWRCTAVLYSSLLCKRHHLLFTKGIISEDFVFNLAVLSVSNKVSFYHGVTLINQKRQGSITTTFNENLIDSYLFIDKASKLFIEQNKIKPSQGQYYLDSLLCRNVVVYITSILSKKNKKSLYKKYSDLKLVLQNNRIKNALSARRKSTPYFNNRKKVMYFRLMFFLLSKRYVMPAFIFAYIASKVSQKG